MQNANLRPNTNRDTRRSNRVKRRLIKYAALRKPGKISLCARYGGKEDKFHGKQSNADTKHDLRNSGA